MNLLIESKLLNVRPTRHKPNSGDNLFCETEIIGIVFAWEPFASLSDIKRFRSSEFSAS